MKGFNYIAHRGLFDNDKGIPENSLPAFLRAIEKGLPIEFDVRATRDGKLLVFHDKSLRRMTGLNKKVLFTRYREIRKLRLLDTHYTIPTFDQVLSLVDGQVPLLIEIKNSFIAGRVEKRIFERLSSYKGTYIVESFNPWVLFWMKRHVPKVVRGQLIASSKKTRNPIEKFIMFMKGFYSLTKPDFIACDASRLNPRLSKKFRQKGLKVLCWTVKSFEDYLKVYRISDGVIFDTISPEEIGYKKQ